MKSNDSYRLKIGLTLNNLAREMMTYHVGDRIPAITELVERYQVSRGTIQSALAQLCKAAMTLKKSGHLGSYITAIDHRKIWEYTGWNTLIGAMPLPSNNSLKGLATALTTSIEYAHLPFNMAFMQSAQNRVNGLLARRFDFIVVSRLSADICLEKNPQLTIAVELPRGSYNKSHIIAFSNPKETKLRDGMRVAYDPFSYDQTRLTHLCCEGLNIQYFHMPYRATLHCLEHGDVDAVIYLKESAVRSTRKLGISPIPYEDPLSKSIYAVLLTSKENYWCSELLHSSISPDMIMDLEQEVEANTLFSYY